MSELNGIFEGSYSGTGPLVDFVEKMNDMFELTRNVKIKVESGFVGNHPTIKFINSGDASTVLVDLGGINGGT